MVTTNLLVLLQALPGTVPWGVFCDHLNAFTTRMTRVSVPEATLLVMSVGLRRSSVASSVDLPGKAFNQRPATCPLLCAMDDDFGGDSDGGAHQNTRCVLAKACWGPLIVGLLTGSLAAVTGPNVNTTQSR